MKILILSITTITVLSVLSCKNPKHKADSVLGNVSEDLEKELVEKPVYIQSVFPEEGLTDPHALVDNGRLYLFCGHDESWDTESSWKMNRWEIRSSNNLIDWQKDGEILPTQTYIGDKSNCWAGDITKRGNKYYWFFSNKNYSTGVMVANSPTGPWTDPLGKPLLPTGIVGKIHPYDPSILKEEDKYTIFFGAGKYYAATLAEDMISLASKPKPISVIDKNGEEMWTDDKSTIFKRNNWYYLVWGPKYAMSKNLYGPYQFQGAFLKGGHNDVFQWKDQWYASIANKEIGLFYRGVSIKSLYFNEDGTVRIPKDDKDYPAKGRQWEFKYSTMGWHSKQGTSLEWDKLGFIKGKIEGKGEAIIEGPVWTGANLKQANNIIVKIKNLSGATKGRIRVASHTLGKKFWKHPEIDWNKELKIDFDIKPNNSEIQVLKFKISDFGNVKPSLKKLRIEPALGVTSGNWEVHYISVE